MNPKNILILTLIIVLSSCGTSSNFQKRKHLNLKPLETSSSENTSSDVKQTSDIVKQESIDEEKNEEVTTTEFKENKQSLEYSDLTDEIITNNSIVEERNHPEITTEKHKELFEPLDATRMEEQKKGIIFLCIGAAFFVIGGITLSLLFSEFITPLVGGIIIGVVVIALIVFGLLALINGKRALNGKKENAWHWIARIAALAGGIIGLVAAGLYLGNFVFFLLFF